MDNAGTDFTLSPTYDALFDNSSEALFSNPEILFSTKGEPNAGIGIGNFWGFDAGANPTYLDMAATGTMVVGSQTIKYDSTRVSSQFVDVGFLGIDCLKYRDGSPVDPFEMIYHFRLAEVYLIFAEAQARVNNSVTIEALDALNAIRQRSGATNTGGDGFEVYPATISLDQFLEAVRIEKMIELGAEQGEEWFDLVRYDFADGFGAGFQVSDVKAEATDPDKFILPIPEESREAGGDVVDQNPSY